LASQVDIGDLFETHGQRVARTIERLTGRGAHVDDLLQETFVTAFKRRHTFDAGRSKASMWLYTITINHCRRYLRDHRRKEFFPGKFVREVAPKTPETPERQAARDQDIEMVNEALQKLPAKQREVFVLFEQMGLEGKEIGAILGIKEGTVWTRVHHARKNFKRYIERRVRADG
jgi:RNA polymerase sigma-70 factor (ECF subfamily)